MGTMARRAALASLLLALPAAAATSCAGDASDSCSGRLHSCTSEGLCVLDADDGTCCVLGSEGCASELFDICAPVGLGLAVDDSASDEAVRDFAAAVEGGECHNVEIGMILDRHPEETRWEITKGRRNSVEHANVNLVEASPFYDPDKRFTEASDTHVICLPDGKYTFTIVDSAGDGLCCTPGKGEGRYALTYQESGEIIAHGSEFGDYAAKTFSVPYVPPPFNDGDGDGLEDRTGNVIPTMPLSPDGSGSCENEFGLSLRTDDYGVETTWELRRRAESGDYADGPVVASGGPYTSDKKYDLAYCVEPGRYTFVFYDWQCDGLEGVELDGRYEVKVNGMTVHEGGRGHYEYEELVELEFVNELRGRGPNGLDPVSIGRDISGAGRRAGIAALVAGAAAAAVAVLAM